MWWLQDMLHGAPIGFVVVGTLVHYEDRAFIPIVNELFGFHKNTKNCLQMFRLVNNVALMQGQGRSGVSGDHKITFRGAYYV
jgi:hypothetical protein